VGSLGLTSAVLGRLGAVPSGSASFLAWADGKGGAWRYDLALWIRERCDFAGEAIVCAVARADGPGGPWAARAATPAERGAFLRPLPVWTGIVVGRTAKGLPVALQDGRDAKSTRVVRGDIHASLFERVEARIVNGEILAQRVSGSALACELRSHLERGFDLYQRMRAASLLHRRAFTLARDIAAAELEGSLGARIESALASGGARLVDWRSLPGREVSILWTPVHGALAEQFIESRACSQTLGLLHAGICVSGGDAAFDVASLASAVARQPGAPRPGWANRLHL
jgi:hypothetical protein